MSELIAGTNVAARYRGLFWLGKSLKTVADFLPRARARPITLLVISGAILITMILIATAITIVKLRDRELTDSETGLRNLALVLSEQTDRSFQAVELVQKSLIDRMQMLGILTSEEYEQKMSGIDTHSMLKVIIGGLPQLDAVTMINSHGKLINFSRYWPIPNVNVSDRDYFKALKSNANLTSFISEPVRNRGTGTWTIYIARRFSGPKGEFIGLVLGAMELKYFEEFYKKVALGSDGSIALTRTDGMLLARYPNKSDRIGTSLATNPLFSSLVSNANQRAVRMTSVVDGQDRMIAAHRLPNYPIFVAVGTTIAAALANWRTGALYMTSFAGLLAVVVGGITFLTGRQITKRLYAKNIELDHIAHHDALTGLPNRVTFNETIKSKLDCAANNGEQVAILMIDLDRFKEANDTYGHSVGDELLCEIARRLQMVTEEAFLARIGGDEFVSVRTSDSMETVKAFAERLLGTVAEDIEARGHRIRLRMTVGGAIYPSDGLDIETLMINADAALYFAKSNARGTAIFFEPEMGNRRHERLTLQEDLRSGIDHGELELHYQPQVKISGEAVGFEALVRWRSPKRGMVFPSTFIPIAEESNLIIAIGEWVLREACREAVRWSQPLNIAVNVSPNQFYQCDLPQLVHAVLLETGLRPGRLELEITENVLVNDFSRAVSILNRLKSLGVRIAMDDFGTGYSSLSYLQSFICDKIKVDRVFVCDLETNHHSQKIVRAILGLGRSLALPILAEGVETIAQHEFLMQEGCDEVQGYLFGRPLPISGYASLIGHRLHAEINCSSAWPEQADTVLSHKSRIRSNRPVSA